MYDLLLARAIHVVALVHWIGGVAFVTTIVLPSARKAATAKEALALFAAFERRFAPQVRVSILLVGLSGAYMLSKMHTWYLLQSLSFWWLDLMIAVWIAFAIMVYVLEPLGADRRFAEFAMCDKDRAFGIMTHLHEVALIVSAIAVGAGVLGAHGGL